MGRTAKDGPSLLVTVEVGRSCLRMVAVERSAANRPADVRTRTFRWRQQAHSLLSDAGASELTQAFKQLVAEERLTGKRLRITLTGDFCVTRVLTGTDERVRRELAQLEERSQRYLSLGPGQKALAGSIRQIDARHQHALLSVANQKTLDTLLHVAASVGVQLELIEPSLVALSRVVGQLGYDHDQPTMIVNVDERGVELGISYGGQLLLDYRPGGREVHGEIAGIVLQHLSRLRRYCSRYFRYAQGDLRTAYLCGSHEQLDALQAEFEKSGELTVARLDPAQLDLTWRYAESPPGSELAAAIGTCLVPHGGDPARPSPNLMEHLEQHRAESLARRLLRVGWPVAAVLLLALGLATINVMQSREVAALASQVAAFEPLRQQVTQQRMTLVRAEMKHRYLKQIDERLTRPAWEDVLDLIGRSMPADVWLDQVQLERDGQLQIAGASYGEEGVFELVNWLEKTPLFADVALQGVGPGRREGGKLVQFHLQTKLEGCAAQEETHD